MGEGEDATVQPRIGEEDVVDATRDDPLDGLGLVVGREVHVAVEERHHAVGGGVARSREAHREDSESSAVIAGHALEETHHDLARQTVEGAGDYPQREGHSSGGGGGGGGSAAVCVEGSECGGEVIVHGVCGTDPLEDFAEENGQCGRGVTHIRGVSRGRKAREVQERKGLQRQGGLVQRVADGAHERRLQLRVVEQDQLRLSLEVVHRGRQRANRVVHGREDQLGAQLVERRLPRSGGGPDVLQREVEETELGESHAEAEALLGVQLVERHCAEVQVRQRHRQPHDRLQW